jgi:hypothetical protein
MKWNRSVLPVLGLLIFVASLYRVWDGRPFGFAPQIAMALFSGALIRDKRLAVILPLLSMLFSDVLYQLLYINGLSEIRGFYEGQWINYLLIGGLTFLGFLMKKVNLLNILGFSVSGSLLFFITSNFFVWFGGGGFNRPKTFDGLLMCYTDALAFYREHGLINGFYGNVFAGDIFFCFILFGGYHLINRYFFQPKHLLA